MASRRGNPFGTSVLCDQIDRTGNIPLRMAPTSAARLIALGPVVASIAFLAGSPRASAQSAAGAPPYRDPGRSVDERVADLVGRMTLEEKVGQLLMLDARSEDLSFVNTRQPGALLHILGAK